MKVHSIIVPITVGVADSFRQLDYFANEYLKKDAPAKGRVTVKDQVFPTFVIRVLTFNDN
jgi:hypothetical protein